LDDHDDLPPRRSGALAFALPLITAVAALAVGGAVGGLGVLAWWRATPPQVETVTQLRDLTDAELESMCNPFLTDTLSVLTEAQSKVVDLEDRVKAKEARIAELEEQQKRGAVAGQRVRAELEAARAELATLREQLATAVAEKDAALVELEKTVETLRQTEVKLEETETKLGVAENDVVSSRWRAFTQEAQLEICERGGRRKMGKCRESVDAALGPELERAYRHCLRSGQAVPGLREASRDLTGLPDHARWLNEDDRVVKGWYIVLCDPTLPEAADFTEALQGIQRAEEGTPGDAIEGALREIEDLDD
jgi:predicted  nucleic acid-binding Zn-ribbon protein